MTGHYEEFTKMFVAVDCIVFGFDGTTLQVLIGHRKMEPGRGALSLSGGLSFPMKVWTTVPTAHSSTSWEWRTST